MGVDKEFPLAFAKAELGAGEKIPKGGTVFISVNPFDRGALNARPPAIVWPSWFVVWFPSASRSWVMWA